MGRAARHIRGQAILSADNMTDSMAQAIEETARRLNSQELDQVQEHNNYVLLENIPELIKQLEIQMKTAAKDQAFEDAAKYRDRIKQLRDKMTGQRS
jgi:excinuclease ABC subunit B